MYSLHTNIKTGDIVLLRGSAKHSRIISAVTRGPFSHACLALGQSQMIEAMASSGVQYSSCLRYAVSDILNIAVLRPMFVDDLQANEVRSKIRDIAKGHQSRGYDLVGAILSVLGTSESKKAEKYFCSQLIASIYREAGFPLFNKKEHRVTPNDFLKCAHLINITNTSIDQVPDYIEKRIMKNEIEIPLLDKGGVSTSENALLLREFLAKSQKIFAECSLKPPARMFDIIDAITDSKNSGIAVTLDDKITMLYDSLKINNKLELHRLSSFLESVFGNTYL